MTPIQDFARRIVRELGRRLCAKGEHWWGALRPLPERPHSPIWARQCIRPDCGQWDYHQVRK